MFNKKRGFTLVEFIIVITVIGIISGMTTLSFIKVQTDAKDSQRSNQVKIVAEALEKYFIKNGEYPSCNAMAGSAASVASLLGIESSVLKTPTAVSGANSIIAACGDLSVGVDSFAYRGDTSCIASPAIACTKYTLKYRGESTNSVLSLASRKGQILTLNSIAAISGSVTAIGNVLTAGATDPSDATVTYQWQKSTSAGGTYANIGGATNTTYTLMSYDIGMYLKVVATGTGSYIGTVTSAATAQVTDTNWIAIGTQIWAKANLNVGTQVNLTVNQTNNASVEKYCYVDCNGGGQYQWDEAMGYSLTEGAQGICPAGSHIPTDAEFKILEMYLGMSQVDADSVAGPTRGSAQAIGTKLMAGGASGLNLPLPGWVDTYSAGQQYAWEDYLWTSSGDSVNAIWRNVRSGNGGVGRSSISINFGYSVRCLMNGQLPITAIAAISGSTNGVGNTLTAGALTPGAATAVYQWQNATTAGGTYSDISGATNNTYTLQISDIGKYIKVKATGTNAYTGTVNSAATAQITDSNWIAGIVSTPLEGKYVRSSDLAGTYQYAPSSGDIVSPQGVYGLDTNKTTSMALVNPQTNPGVDFSNYPAQNACKAIGGRLPYTLELLSIYSNKASYGNNFQAYYYWSATGYANWYYWAYATWLGTGAEEYRYKTDSNYVRCVY